jgi:hypothetical protein
VDKKRYQNPKTKGETLGMNFEIAVLEGDRTRLFWEKDNVRKQFWDSNLTCLFI